MIAAHLPNMLLSLEIAILYENMKKMRNFSAKGEKRSLQKDNIPHKRLKFGKFNPSGRLLDSE